MIITGTLLEKKRKETFVESKLKEIRVDHHDDAELITSINPSLGDCKGS